MNRYSEKKKTAALYMRLSKEDERRREESASIVSQRHLLRRYAGDHLPDYEICEYADDGFSGTNFERPAVSELLCRAERGEIACIVVKDFSRFARNYIDMGEYLEKIFPMWGVRFISVGDHYDSLTCREGVPDLGTDFKNLLYDLYSRDLSRKVKMSLDIRRHRGEYVSANCPYGYQRTPEDRHRLCLVPEEAAVVRKIFSLAATGMTGWEIAGFLNRGKWKTPGGKEGTCWSASSVYHILANRTYTGDMIYEKYEQESVGGRAHKKAREEWKVFPAHHEAIVTTEEFEAVRRRLRRRKRKNNR